MWNLLFINFVLELRGIEPRAFRMQSEHSTTELQPRWNDGIIILIYFLFMFNLKLYISIR